MSYKNPEILKNNPMSASVAKSIAERDADTIAKHFYEQGKADGIKNIVNESKNIDAASRPQNNEAIFINGLRVKAINGVDSSKLKIQKRKTKN